MNYRHEFHAGNFADVLKHAALARVLLYLRRKDKPFRVIDTHAGAGRYDLEGAEASRSGEARDGVLRLLDGVPAGAAADLLAPYLDSVRAAGAPQFYPGSPLIVRELLRQQDRATFCELLPQAATSLRRALGRDERVKAIEIDGYTGLKAYVPPVERRGLVLIDPPFERRDEYERLFDSLQTALRKWPGGTYMVWQPVKEPDVAESFSRAVAAEAENCLRIDLQAESPQAGKPLARTGLLIVNPPYVLEEEMKTILITLTPLLARGPGADFFISHYGAA